MNKKKIAIIGARGIANYGGFETMVAELAPRLVERGFDVYCSCEKNGSKLEKTYKGAKLIYFPLFMPSNYKARKIFEIIYDIYFNLVCPTYYKCDVVYSLGTGANLFTIVPRLFGKKSIVNVDGLEWRRSKFNSFEKLTLKILFKLVLLSADYIIIDSCALMTYIPKKYHNKIKYIPYGVSELPEILWQQELLSSYLKKDYVKILPAEYWLVVARLEPENNIHLIIKSYLKSNSTKPLLIVGDFTSRKYEDLINKLLDDTSFNKKILFAGAIYNQDVLNMLRQNCFAYIHGHSVGGTNPSLLEAMTMKNIIIAHDNEFNREVCGNSAVYFKDSMALKDRFNQVDKNYSEYLKFKKNAYERVIKLYSWDCVVNKYEELFYNIIESDNK